MSRGNSSFFSMLQIPAFGAYQSFGFIKGFLPQGSEVDILHTFLLYYILEGNCNIKIPTQSKLWFLSYREARRMKRLAKRGKRWRRRLHEASLSRQELDNQIFEAILLQVWQVQPLNFRLLWKEVESCCVTYSSL